MPRLRVALLRLPHSACRLLCAALAGAALFLAAAAAGAAVHCVRAGAAGDGSGSDWTNAYTQLPADLVRGDIYYVAAGTYPGYGFNDPEDGTKMISVLKAVAADHGPDAGWQPDFGRGVAVWASLSYSRSYYLFDGVTGAGRTGHGFELFPTQGNGTLVDFSNGVHDVNIRHVHMHYADRALSIGDAIYGD
jgi:hypothetical protein